MIPGVCSEKASTNLVEGVSYSRTISYASPRQKFRTNSTPSPFFRQVWFELDTGSNWRPSNLFRHADGMGSPTVLSKYVTGYTGMVRDYSMPAPDDR